jgi:hypothetical protein
MVDIPTWTLLALTGKDQVFCDPDRASQVRADLARALNAGQIGELWREDGCEKLPRDWNIVLNDKLFESQPDGDLVTVGFPDLGMIGREESPSYEAASPTLLGTTSSLGSVGAYRDPDPFVWAGYLPAGRHQVVIYDQQEDTLWMKEFMVDLIE